jgi:hypothetical protein
MTFVPSPIGRGSVDSERFLRDKMRVPIEVCVALISQILDSGKNLTFRSFKEALKEQKNITGSDRDVFDLYNKAKKSLSVRIVDNKNNDYADLFNLIVEKTNELVLGRVASLEKFVDEQNLDINGLIAEKENLLEHIENLNSKLGDLEKNIILCLITTTNCNSRTTT